MAITNQKKMEAALITACNPWPSNRELVLKAVTE